LDEYLEDLRSRLLSELRSVQELRQRLLGRLSNLLEDVRSMQEYYRAMLSRKTVEGVAGNIARIAESLRLAERSLAKALDLLKKLDATPHTDPKTFEKIIQDITDALSEALRYVDDPRLVKEIRKAIDEIQNLKTVAPSKAEPRAEQPATQQRVPEELPELYPPTPPKEKTRKRRRKPITILQTV